MNVCFRLTKPLRNNSEGLFLYIPDTKCSSAMIEGNFQDYCKEGRIFQRKNSFSYDM